MKYPTKKRVAIYTRVSTDEQVTGNGLDIQERALMDYINAHQSQYVFSKTNKYVDEWKSGAEKSKSERPALHKMFQDAKNNKFDILLVWKIDRFFRKTLFLLEWVETLDKLGIWFISITQPFDTTQPFWKMMLQMLAVISELERDLIRERTQKWILESMKKWKWWRWSPPYWYRVDENKNLIIDPNEAKVVKMMFELLVKEKLSLSQLVREVNKAGIETAAHTWSLWKRRKKDAKHKNSWLRWVVHRVVRNEIYKWKLIQNKNMIDKYTGKTIEKPESEWVVWESPMIVSKKLFEDAQAQLEFNRRYSERNKKRNVYMLSTLLVDKWSGKKFVWYMSWKKTKNYRLNSDNTKTSFKIIPKWISWDKLEPIVWNKISSILLQPKLIIQELEKLSKDHNEDYVKYQIEILKKKKKSLEDNTRYLLSMSIDMSVDDMEIMKKNIQNNRSDIDKYDLEMKDLESTILSNDQRRAQLKDLEKLSQKFKTLLENGKLSYEIKTQICRLLIKKITLDDERNIEIFMYVPIKQRNRRTKADYRTELVDALFDKGKDIMSTTIKHLEHTTKQLRDFSSELLLCHNYGTPGRIRTHANLGPRPSALPLSYGCIYYVRYWAWVVYTKTRNVKYILFQEKVQNNIA